jgi:hypothetical protein
VTTNARDFLGLLTFDIHLGLIVLREGNLSPDEQWRRLTVALDHIHSQPGDPDSYMVNRVIEVSASNAFRVYERPAPPD